MASLVYTDGDTVEYSFTVGAEPVLVGRAPECAIRSNHPLVSRNHARFYVDQAGTLYIEDLGSANGVYVGQQRVSHSAVPVGEIVVVGSLTFRQMPDAYGQPPGNAYGQPPSDPYGQPPADPYAPPAYGQPPYAPPPANAFAPQPGDISTQPASNAYGQPPPNGYAPPAAGTPPPVIAPPPMGPPPGMAPPEMPPPMAAPEMSPPPEMPPPMAAPEMPPPAAQQHIVGGADLAVAHLLETERKARVAAEEERDAYGARMAELHGELRSLREQLQAQPQAAAAPNPELDQRLGELLAERTKALTELGTAKDTIAKQQAQLQGIAAAGGAEARLATVEAELQSYRDRLSDADDRVNAAESRLRSTEEELAVARADLLKSEERIMSEMAASEQRGSAELAMRVDELNIARADTSKAEERVVELSRKVAELEQLLAQARGAF